MSIEVRISTSVSPLWTFIEVLTKHIVFTQNRAPFDIELCCLAHSVSLSLTPIMCISIVSLFFCFYPAEPICIASAYYLLHQL